MAFDFVVHDPIAQANYGIGGQSISTPKISGLGVISFGFLWSIGDWSRCYDSPVTTWTGMVAPVTGWTLCAPAVATTWTEV